MIAKSYIKSSLEELDKLYINASSQKKAIYFSKIALIELCGWIEDTLDDITLKHASRKLINVANKKYYKKNVVGRNSGFEYDINVRPMFISLIGLIELEKLEIKLERTAKITLLKSYLGNLKPTRNDAAHTHLRGITKTYNAPSRTLGDFNNICAILEIIDKELRNPE